MRDAVGLARLGEQSTAKHGRHRDERQPSIFANEQAQAIRQLDLLDLAREATALARVALLRQRALRIERDRS